VLTVKQAAERLGVCPALVYDWCSSRLLPHFRLGSRGKRGKILIREEDLDRYLEASRVGAEVSKPPPPQKPAFTPKHLRLKPS
jgi:excisionase family DNA binding protein